MHILIAAAFGALVAFSPADVPSNMVSPQTASFQLSGFEVHEGGHDTNAPKPVYMAESEKFRAAALIRFTPDFDGLCYAFEMSKPDEKGVVHRVGLPIALDPNEDGTFEVEKGKQIKVLAIFADQSDIESQGLDVDVKHRSVAVGCYKQADKSVIYSQLYAIGAPESQATTTT